MEVACPAAPGVDSTGPILIEGAQHAAYTMLVHVLASDHPGPGPVPRRLLVFVPNWVGDVVMATAALRALRGAFGPSRIVHLMRSYVAEVLAGANLCDDMRFWPASSAGYGSLIRSLRRERFDTAVLFTNSFRSALLARLSGARRRVGYARDARGWMLTDRLYPPREGGRFVPMSALDYYNAIARHMGCTDVGDRLYLATTPADEASIDARLGPGPVQRPLVVLNPGSNYGTAKRWPPEYYAALSDALSEQCGARVIASLAPGERDVADRIRREARRPIDVFIDPPLGLGPLKALIRRCDLLVTNDTGPRHFAAAFGRPVLTVFGSSDPAWTDTRFAGERIARLSLDCQPCMERECPLKHHQCMKDLCPEPVIAMAAAILEKSKRPLAGALAR